MEHTLNAHAKPPPNIRAIYKDFHKAHASSLRSNMDLVQFQDFTSDPDSNIKLKRCLDLPSGIRQALVRFLGSDQDVSDSLGAVYEIVDVPGLYMYPSLLPPAIQLELLDRLLHRDLCNPEHQTNVHMHYHVPYPSSTNEQHSSFFDPSASGNTFLPRNPDVHKSISNEQFLNKKLRWTTLGGQYDWTNKVYPSGPPPAFPSDVKDLIEDIFPMKAEAAIVNVYSPGDTLSLHRDVSEECNRPLASVSLGCDALFIAGLDGVNVDGRPSVATIRLRSGDAVLMSGKSRYAWHGVPKVIEGTCPAWMENWPSRADKHDGGRFEQWRGWMKGKRVNLNVRQMFG